MVTEVCETTQTSRWDGSHTAKILPVSDTSTCGLGVRCTSRMLSYRQTHIMSLDIINGSVHSLAACTAVALRVATRRHSTQCSTRPWVNFIVKQQRCIERVKTCGYMYSLWECQWDKICKPGVEVRWIVTRWKLNWIHVMQCMKVVVRHLLSTDRSVIKYVDVQSLYPYVCKSKHYPVSHTRCLIGPNFRCLYVNSY